MWHKKGILLDMKFRHFWKEARKQLAFQAEEIDADGLVLTDTTRNPRPGEEDGKGTELLVPVVSCPFTLNHRRPTQMRDQRRRANVCFTPFYVTNPSHPVKRRPQLFLLPSDLHTVLFFFSPRVDSSHPRCNRGEPLFLLSFFSIGLNKLPFLLGATLLPVADVFSSEDLEMSTSFSCPNESETADKGDLKCDSWSQLTFVLKAEGSGVTFIILARCHSISRVQYVAKKRKRSQGCTTHSTLWSKKLLKIAPCHSSLPVWAPREVPCPETCPRPCCGWLMEQPLASCCELSSGDKQECCPAVMSHIVLKWCSGPKFAAISFTFCFFFWDHYC